MDYVSITEKASGVQISPPYEVTDQNGAVPIWYILSMTAVVLVALFLNFFRLGQDGYGNLYYAAGVKSMLMNWHNFFFVSFDPAGFVSIDKPPLAFWLQVASARLFGLSPWSVMLPQAVAGVLSVPLLAHLVRRTFGPLAGLLAAIALAVTPINVATNRNMTMDSLLVFVLLLATWAIMYAVETGRLRFLLLCAGLVGIGFNIKMLDAYLVLPAFGLFYWCATARAKRERALHLVLATAILLVVSFCWALVVDLTPVVQRPYVGSSGSNSELQLALLYNGSSRLFGNLKEVSLLPRGALAKIINGLPPFARPDFWLGNPRLLRLMIKPLGEQIGWLLPLAVLGVIGVKWEKPSILPLNKQQQGLALWGGWFLTQFIFFSSTSFTHQYYVVQMAPSICALLAIGIVTTWRDTADPRRRWFLPLALIGTSVVSLVLLLPPDAGWELWLVPFVVAGGVMGLLLLRPLGRGRSVLLTSGLCVLLVGPTIWSAIPVFEDRSVAFPYAGPDVPGSPLENEVTQSDQEMMPDSMLISYLLKHQGKARYLVATTAASQSAPIILETGKPVMTLGGYSGGDQILSLAQLKQFIATGTIRYFVFTQTMQEADIGTSLKEYQKNYIALIRLSGIGTIETLTDWVRFHCSSVPQSAWHPSSVTNDRTLLDVFDCA